MPQVFGEEPKQQLAGLLTGISEGALILRGWCLSFVVFTLKKGGHADLNKHYSTFSTSFMQESQRSDKQVGRILLRRAPKPAPTVTVIVHRNGLITSFYVAP